MTQTQIIVLAAGHGQRMNNKILPKVLIPLEGQPLIKHLLIAIEQSGVGARPVIVIGQKAGLVKESLGENYQYVYQTEQLGTGHAVSVTQDALKDKAENIMVLYGDHPYVSAETIRNLAQVHQASDSVITMATVKVPDFNGWRTGFYDFGRVIRNQAGEVAAIIERKDATPQQLEIKEGNPSYFCFEAEWLWSNLNKIKNNNSQKEYYLTDLAGIACSEGYKITTVAIEPREALGVNTPEQLALLESLSRT